ncbi:spore coat protein YutH [Paraliobacillus quinghaiensis]|uniref:Spore coat protein YutH n=1 Tax=Paraliobacillus quinghaiensis TaxID=470815 RepID=A0A917WX97_9BACI|nr:hypothetical protein [Paraliobacillus quinghaiensis]GGM37245.1 spore coat protein YutH [Paraliobacillus quinghaiensis]
MEVDNYQGYQIGDQYYFIAPTEQVEVIHLEHNWCADFLIENGYRQVAKVIQNQQEQWITTENDKHYIVLQANQSSQMKLSHGEQLAHFHQTGALYPYTPNYISTYGLWQSLWEEKLAGFEAYYQTQLEVRPASRYLRLFIDTFPYLIGLTENAIQYVQEANLERRFDRPDQACITFQRYRNQLEHYFIFSDQFFYDHPSRDLAEYIRPFLLDNNEKKNQYIRSFLDDYEKVRPLSVFSWRILFARLLCPIHLFDFIDKAKHQVDSEETYFRYKDLLEKQVNYEKGLKSFYHMVGIDPNQNEIPFLDW